MTLQKLLKILSDKGCRKVYVKALSPNDNSKNQVYLGGSFDVINILPVRDFTSEDPGDWKRMRFKSKLDFAWIDNEGTISIAPEAQLILYPKYPEVRFSGFLKGSKLAPSDLMATRSEGRMLCLGVSEHGKRIGPGLSP